MTLAESAPLEQPMAAAIQKSPSCSLRNTNGGEREKPGRDASSSSLDDLIWSRLDHTKPPKSKPKPDIGSSMMKVIDASKAKKNSNNVSSDTEDTTEALKSGDDTLDDNEIALLRKLMKSSKAFSRGGNDESSPFRRSMGDLGSSHSSFDGLSPRESALIKIQEAHENPTSHLAEDTNSFMISSYICSFPFLLGGFVFLLKASLFLLTCLNMIDASNPSNPLGLPVGVPPVVVIAQMLAMAVAVASQDDIRTALNYFYEGYDPQDLGAAFDGASYWKWLLVVSGLLLEGALGLVTTFILIITSEVVVDLVLNFTAIEFVILLDNVFFELSKQGFLGGKIKREAELVKATEYSIPKWRQKTPTRQILTLVGTFLVLFVSWCLVYTKQLKGDYAAQSVVIQFDDSLNLSLGTYSGSYALELRKGVLGIDRVSYRAMNGEGFIGYCTGSEFWTFSIEDDDPCNNFVARSPISVSFNLLKAADGWSATEDSDLQRYFPMYNFIMEQGCYRDVDCGGLGRGSCVDNQCICEDGFYGIRCDYAAAETCETISVDERNGDFQGSRVYASTYTLLRDSSSKIVEVYQHPVYVAESGTAGGMDVILYTGVRWSLFYSFDGIPDAEDHTYEGLAKYFSSIQFHADVHLKDVEFLTNEAPFNTPNDADSPVGMGWNSVAKADLASSVKLGGVSSTFLCALCDEENNPCQNGNTCGDTGYCLCENGASGSLCQITPLSDGKCDLYYNEPSFNFDGGDCCQASCISTEQNTCGIESSSLLLTIDVGFPFCKDPTIISPCGSESCWSPTSRNIGLLAKKSTPLTTVSANGRILVVAAPGLDALRVFDQQDSRWIQRGPILEGKRKSRFGKTLALSTLPGGVVGRRYGKVPILMAIGLHGKGQAGVRVTRWEPNDLDWRPVGDIIDICALFPTDCDLKALDIGRDGDRVTLVVVRSDNLVLLYRTTLTETGTQPWELNFVADGYDDQAEKGSFIGASLSGRTDVLALTRGVSLEVYFPPDDMNTTQGNLFAVQNYAINMTTEVSLIQTFLKYNETASIVQEASAVKMSVDGKSLLVYCNGDGGIDYVVRYIVSPEVAPLANTVKNFTTSQLSDEEIESGLSKVRFSADASSMAIRVRTVDGPRVRLITYNTTSQDFDFVGARSSDVAEELRLNQDFGNDFIDENGDFGLSYDAGTYVQVGQEGPEGYGIVPRCTGAAKHYRMSILLDENPSFVSWALETYQVLGPLTFRQRTVRECDNCYFDDDRFGRGVIAEDICVQNSYDPCLRARFQSDIGLQIGSGMVLFKGGHEMSRYEGTSTQPFVYLPNPNLVDKCRVTELECGDNEAHIVVQMDLDDFSSKDTSWTLTDGLGAILAQGGNFTDDEDRTTMLSQVCVPKDEILELSILDGFPDSDFFGDMSDGDIYRIDGLCCDWGKGGYKLFVDGKEMHSLEGRRPFRRERVVFDVNGVLAQTVPITIEIQTDGFPDELIWWFETEDRSEIWWWRDYSKMPVLAPNAYVTETVYLLEGETYYLGMWDRFGDGFCCENGPGYYNVYWGAEVDPNKLIVVGDANFGGENSREHLLVISEDSILKATQAPVPQPTTEPPVSNNATTPVDEALVDGNSTVPPMDNVTNSGL